MELFTAKTQLMISTIIGIIFSALGGHDILLHILIACVITDYFSGIACAVKCKTLSSKIGFNGIVKKIFIFAVVYMANLADTATGADAFRNVTIMFYISNEGISILENLSKIGVKVPGKIKKLLDNIGDDVNDDKKDTKSDN